MKHKLETLTDEQLRQVIERGVSWLVHAQEPNGHFRYEYLPYRNVYLQDDNIVRQAGALYTLGEVAKRDSRGKYDNRLKPAIRRAIAHFESLSPQTSYNGQRFRVLRPNPNDRKCPVGATCLALCGILAAAERFPELAVIYSDLIQDYKQFIIAMKKDGAGFRDSFKLTAKTQDDKESSYFNGEALLALARYQRYAARHGLIEPEDAIDRIMGDMFNYLNSPAVPFDVALYLWVMAALKDLTAYDSRHAATFASYALRYTVWRIKSVKNSKSTSHNYGAAAEGLTSAYLVLQPHLPTSELQLFADEIDFWLAHTARTQLDAHAPNQPHQIKNLDRAHGGFLTGLEDPSQRIDFTQHSLLACMQRLCDINKQSL